MGVRSGRRVVRRSLAVAVTLQVLLFGVASAGVFVWPSLPALPRTVDAIIELGGPGDRDSGALTLARDHRARYLVQSTVVAEAGTHKCLPPVPDVTILCFHAEPLTTRGEAQTIRELAERYRWRSIVLVTTPDQAWRAMLRVQRCFPGTVYSSTTPLSTVDWFGQVPYQWAATLKALTIERSC